tara:strand:- start:2222 stop:2833 length:612 start_codon:yes stop_codon:yes gene_type:complete
MSNYSLEDAALATATNATNITALQDSITATQTDVTTLQSSGSGSIANNGIFAEVKRFKSGFVGNKGATSGFTIAATRAQIIAGGATTINVGIGGAFGALDGVLTTGKYMLVCHYPGTGVAWYTNSLPNQWKNQHLLAGFIAGAQVGHIEPEIYYTSGEGQSIPFTIGTGSHVHMRGDGLIDVHLATGNTNSWSYGVISFLKYT